MKRNSLTRLSRTPLLHAPLFRDLDQLFSDDIFRPFGVLNREQLEANGWLPAVDIRETDDSFEFTAELPGLNRDDVHITIEDKVLTLKGARAWNDEENRNSYHRVERAYGSFSRSFTLPSTVDADKVAAKFNDGLLTITVPKAEEVKPRQIKIG